MRFNAKPFHCFHSHTSPFAFIIRQCPKITWYSLVQKEDAGEEHAMAEADMIEKNYQKGIEQALRSVQSVNTGYVRLDVVPLTSLPSVSVQGVGKLSLPLREDQQRESARLRVCVFYLVIYLSVSLSV